MDFVLMLLVVLLESVGFEGRLRILFVVIEVCIMFEVMGE